MVNIERDLNNFDYNIFAKFKQYSLNINSCGKIYSLIAWNSKYG